MLHSKHNHCQLLIAIDVCSRKVRWIDLSLEIHRLCMIARLILSFLPQPHMSIYNQQKVLYETIIATERLLAQRLNIVMQCYHVSNIPLC